MSNGFASTYPSFTSAKWLHHVSCQKVNRRAQHEAEVLLHSNTSLQQLTRPPAEPPPFDQQLESVMTGINYPDHDSNSYLQKTPSTPMIPMIRSLVFHPFVAMALLVHQMMKTISTFTIINPMPHALNELPSKPSPQSLCMAQRWMMTCLSLPPNHSQQHLMISALHHLVASWIYGTLLSQLVVYTTLHHQARTLSVFTISATEQNGITYQFVY